MISASKAIFNYFNLKILRPKVTKNIKNFRKKFCEFWPRTPFLLMKYEINERTRVNYIWKLVFVLKIEFLHWRHCFYYFLCPWDWPLLTFINNSTLLLDINKAEITWRKHHFFGLKKVKNTYKLLFFAWY